MIDIIDLDLTKKEILKVMEDFDDKNKEEKEALYLINKINKRYHKGLSDSFWNRLERFKKKYGITKGELND